MNTSIADHLWQSTVFAAVAALLTLVLRSNRARVRHALWLAASLKFLIPFSLFVTLGAQMHWRKAEVPTPSNFSLVMDQVSDPFNAFALPPVATVGRVQSSTPWPAILSAIWAFGFIAISGSWVIQLRRIRSVVRAGLPIALDIPIRAITSPTTLEPGVFGVFRPILLFPNGIVERLTPAQLESVIEHELYHVRHRDNLAAALHMFVETVFWFHPLVWWIGKRLVAERERACDEAVLLTGGAPQVYAEAILNVCRLYVESPLPCVAGITGSELKQRIETIVKNRTGDPLTRLKKLVLAGTGTAVLAAPIIIGIFNAPASLAQDTSQPVPRFEVASIKPCSLETAMVASGSAASSDRLSTGCAPLAWSDHTGLIQRAYTRFAEGRYHQFGLYAIEGAPDWVRTSFYAIDAKSERPQTTEMMQGPMMQKLLEDRFKLRIHRESREGPVYNLVATKAVKLPPFQAGTCVDLPPLLISPNPVPPDRGHFCRFQIDLGPAASIDAEGATVDGLTMLLDVVLDRHVVDRTGLAGRFSIHLDFAPTKGPASEQPSDRPSIFSALQEQLGLKLEPARGPRPLLVIDHIEKPTDNFAEPAKPQPPPAAPIAAKPAPRPPTAVADDKPLHFDAESIKRVNPSGEEW